MPSLSLREKPDVKQIQASIYDFPKYYDVLFGSDWKAEYDFILASAREHSRRGVRRLFEPACGTGRLLYRFAAAGFAVAGLDLNPRAVAYCNARLKRRGLPPAAFVGDMSDFRLRKRFDVAFNTINSFRHLPSEDAAAAHLQCVAAALGRGGIYVLGLHLTPTRGDPQDEESWAARRGHLCVASRMQSLSLDRRRRRERVAMTIDVHTPTRHFRIADEFIFRTYTASQMRDLLARVPLLEWVETYDFAYRIDEPVRIGPETEDVALVLRRR